MPGGAVRLESGREGACVIPEAAPPEPTPCNHGVRLTDPETDVGPAAGPARSREIDSMTPSYRKGWKTTFEVSCGERCASLPSPDTQSNAVRVSGRQTAPVDAFSREIKELDRAPVAAVEVQRFGTHVRMYRLRAAAERLREETGSTGEDWVPARQERRVGDDFSVAHVVGRSIERKGKILRMERCGVLDGTARYPVERYASRKGGSGQIRLGRRTADFEPWEAEPDGMVVVGEWRRVIE
jgi:hypothetical protein